ncbi:MAG: methylmalonyl-CoA mutase [Chloroflexi bacterium]|nr:methylmalonyl-CoA mutase [Chloroflexota bacterium]
MADKNNEDGLREMTQEWEREYESSLRKRPERKERFENLSWIRVKPLYTPGDIEGLDYERDIGFPGKYPYTRGVYSTMYRVRPWTVRQVIGYGGGVESSQRFKFMEEHGQTGFSIVFDHPTNMGLDSDEEVAEGFVGREGTALDTIQDMRDLLEGVDMEKGGINIIAAHPAILAMVVAVAQERCIDLRNLSGTLQNYPIIGHTMGSCSDIYGGTNFFSKRFCIDIVEYCTRNLPRWNSVSVAVRNTREAGCTAVQEIAFGIAPALAVIKGCVERGINVDEVAPRISFFLNSHRDFFEEIAKFRAMRRLWARVLREELGTKDTRSWQMRFHCQTSGDAMTYQQPLVNIIRGTLYGLAAVLGGCQSLHINSADEGLSIPIEETAKLSLRTHQVILEESGAADMIDPLAGSYYVEWLTNKLEDEARSILNKINSMGDWWDPKVRQWVSREIADASYRFQREVESGERVIIGVNKYVEEIKYPFPIWREDKEFTEKQLARLNKVKEKRDVKRWEEAANNLRDACKNGVNILPPTIDAVKAYMTIGEITKIYMENS